MTKVGREKRDASKTNLTNSIPQPSILISSPWA